MQAESFPLASLRFVMAASAGLMAFVLACLLVSTGGQFYYAIDDAYIHLALASHLPGHFGTTPGIISSPSSSLLFPWLLVPFANWALAPFLYNLIGLFLSLALLCRIEAQIAPRQLYPARYAGLVIVAIALVANLYTLPFLGLEHSLHVAASLAILSGLLDVQQGRQAPRWLWLALIAAPLLRYEGFALSGLALLWLLTRPACRRAALASGAVIVSIHLGYAVWLHEMGLPWVPGSISVKLQPHDPNLPWVIANLLRNLITEEGGRIVWLVGLLPILAILRPSPAIWIVTLAVAAHFAFGHLGWMNRYQAYALALGFMAALLAAHQLASSKARRVTMLASLIVIFELIAPQTMASLWMVPRAASELRLQTAQTSRFVKEYWRKPFAANDIGLPSWQNPQPVHDLIGLGSEEVRRIRLNEGGWTAARMADYAQRYHVDLAIIYPGWFGRAIPPAWQPLATLSFAGDPAALDRNAVAFYATRPEAAAEIRNLLNLFKPGLPAQANLELSPPAQ